MASFLPKVGTWYREIASGQRFEVISVDSREGTIEVMYEDGNFEGFDTVSWSHFDHELASPPSTCSASPFDGIDEFSDSIGDDGDLYGDFDSLDDL